MGNSFHGARIYEADYRDDRVTIYFGSEEGKLRWLRTMESIKDKAGVERVERRIPASKMQDIERKKERETHTGIAMNRETDKRVTSLLDQWRGVYPKVVKQWDGWAHAERSTLFRFMTGEAYLAEMDRWAGKGSAHDFYGWRFEDCRGLHRIHVWVNTPRRYCAFNMFKHVPLGGIGQPETPAEREALIKSIGFKPESDAAFLRRLEREEAGASRDLPAKRARMGFDITKQVGYRGPIGGSSIYDDPTDPFNELGDV